MKSNSTNKGQNERLEDGHLFNETLTRENTEDTSSSGTLSSDDDDNDIEENHNDDDNTSSVNAEEVNEEECLRRPKIPKPLIRNDLKSRLSMFLPQIQKANQDLEDAGDVLANQIEDVGEDEEQYIEMDLSLGVLSGRRHSDDVQTGHSDSENELRNGDSDTSKDVLQNLKSINGTTVTRKIEEM